MRRATARSAAAWLAVACALLAWPAAGSAGPLAAVDGRGRLVRLPRPPQRIVSLMPSATEVLFALGLKGRIVADSDYCDYPPEARSLPHVGGDTTSLEKVVAVRPDLIVASTLGNRRAVQRLDSMRGPAAPVFTLQAETLPELYAAIVSLGRVTGTERRAAALVAAMRARVAAVARRLASERTRPGAVFVVQTDPLWVGGAGTFIDDLIVSAGGTNVGRAAGTGYGPLSPERLVAARPDVVLTGMEDARVLAGRGGCSATPALRRGAVYALGPAELRPGPRLVDALERLARILHPTAFRTGRAPQTPQAPPARRSSPAPRASQRS